jgi:hypothetical protein
MAAMGTRPDTPVLQHTFSGGLPMASGLECSSSARVAETSLSRPRFSSRRIPSVTRKPSGRGSNSTTSTSGPHAATPPPRTTLHAGDRLVGDTRANADDGMTTEQAEAFRSTRGS